MLILFYSLSCFRYWIFHIFISATLSSCPSTSCYFSFPFLFHCHNSLSMSRFMIFLIFYSTLLLLRMFFSFISRWIIELFFFSPSEDNNVYFFSLSQLVFLFLLLVTLFWRCNIFRSILPTLFFFINWINSSLLLNPCNSFFPVFFSSFYIIKISSPRSESLPFFSIIRIPSFLRSSNSKLRCNSLPQFFCRLNQVENIRYPWRRMN